MQFLFCKIVDFLKITRQQNYSCEIFISNQYYFIDRKKKSRIYRNGPKTAFTGTDNDRDDKLDQVLFKWINAIKTSKTQNL